MTPKDKLISELSVFLHDAFHAGFNAENVSQLDNFDGFAEAEEAVNNYAVGRWVSVNERLPDQSGCYLFVWDGGEPHWIDYTHGLTDGETPTHWLELNLPEVKL